MSTNERDAKAGKTILSNLLLTKMMHNFQNRRRGGKRSMASNQRQQGLFHWHRRLINEMKQSPRIQEKLLDGSFDRYMEK